MCTNSGYDVADHFKDFLGMVEIGLGAKCKLIDLNVIYLKSEDGGEIEGVYC